MLQGLRPGGERDLVFIPVGINYDRVLEDRSLLRKLDPPAAASACGASSRSLARFASRQSILAVLRQRRYRLRLRLRQLRHAGVDARATSPRAASTSARLDDAGRRAAGRRSSAAMLMARIGAVVPVLPVPLVATVLLRDAAQRRSRELELKAAVQALMRRRRGAPAAHVYVPRTDRDYALTVGLRMLDPARASSTSTTACSSANPAELTILRYYANSIAHLVA